MARSLKHSVALVTGGAGGIGSAITMKLASEGADVVITYNANESRAKALLARLPEGNHKVLHAPTTDVDKVSALAGFIEKEYGRLDILVNNAGITTPIPHQDLASLTDEWIDKIMQTNVRGTFAMIRACKEPAHQKQWIGGQYFVDSRHHGYWQQCRLLCLQGSN